MKTILNIGNVAWLQKFCALVIVLSSLAVTGAASAAEYKYFNTVGGWNKSIEGFLNDNNVEPSSISSSWSGDTDLHIFYTPGLSDTKFELISYHTSQVVGWQTITKNLIGGGKAKLLGFSGPNVWILTWQ